MMTIDINLITPKAQKSIVPYAVVCGIVSIAMVYSIYNLYSYRINSQELRVLEAMFFRLENMKERERASFEKEDAKEIEKKVGFINEIISREVFSWTELLTDIEEVMPKNVSIVEITPHFKEGKILISGMAETVDDVLGFVTRLSSSENFSGVFLLKHSEEKKEGTSEKVFFNISAIYKKEGSP